MATKQSLNSETEEKVKKTTARKTAATNTKAKKTEAESESGVKKPRTTKKKSEDSAAEAMEKKPAARKRTAASKTASATKTDVEPKKTVATGKTAARKTTAKKTDAENEPAIKKTAAKTPAGTRKTAARKTDASKSDGNGSVEAKKPVRKTAARKASAVPKEDSGMEIKAESKVTAEASDKTVLSPTGVMPKINVDSSGSVENKNIGYRPDEKDDSAVLAERYAETSLEVTETDTIASDKNEDFKALEEMMQTAGLRKKTEGTYAQYREKKNGRKWLLLLLLLLGLFGTGIGIGIKFFSGSGIEKTIQSPEDIIAYCEKLIGKGEYAQALGILSGLNINGTDDHSVSLRNQINALMKSGFEKAVVEGRENEILDAVEALSKKGKYSEALKILASGASLSGDDEKFSAVKNRIHDLEKNIVEKAVIEGHAQDVVDTAKKLIGDGEFLPAMEILDFLEVKGNDAESRMLRNQIYSLKKDAVKKAVADGKTEDVLDFIENLSRNGDAVNALEYLSYVEIDGNGENADSLRERLSNQKKDVLKKALEDGKQEEIIAKARQMIADGDYETALEFLSSVKPEGDDLESRAFRNTLKSLKNDTVARALAEGRIDDVLKTADALSNNGQYADAVELLDMIDISGNSAEANALRDRVNDRKKEIVDKAVENGKAGQFIENAARMIDDGDYSGAVKLLNSAKIDGNDDDLKKLQKEVDSLKKTAVRKAVEEGRGEEILDTAEKIMRNGDYKGAEEILSELLDSGNSPESKALKEKAERMKRQNEVFSMGQGMTDDEKTALAEKLIKEGRYDEALALLNSIDASGNDKESKKLDEKISNLKKDAVARAKKNGVDLGVLGYDENGNPVLSKEEIARRQQQEKNAREAAERKHDEEVLAEKLKKEVEEKFRKEQEAIKVAEEKKAKQEAAAKAAEEKKNRELAEKKAAEEKKAREVAAKKAEEEKRLQEENARNASQKARKDIENSIAEGKKLLEQGSVDGAIKAFEKAESLLPEDDKLYSGEKLGEIANALYEASEKSSGEQKKQLEKLSGEKALAAIARNPGDPNALFVAGMDAITKRNLSGAEEYLMNAIAKNPTNYMYYYQLGRVLAMQKKYDKSLNAFQSCVKLNDRFAPAYYNSGYVSEQSGKKQDALSYYRKATEVNPSHENAHIGQGHIFMEMKKYDEAMKAFTKAQGINPNRSQIYQELGSCCVEQKKYAEAENYFKKALTCPDVSKEKNALTYYNLATVMYEQNKKTEALDYAKKAYDSKDRTEKSVKSNIVYVYGLVVQDSGRDDEAIKIYNEGLLIDSSHVKTNTNLGVLYLKKNRAPEAVVVLTNAYNAESGNFEVNNNLGSAYRQIKDFKKSAEHYKKALAVNPKDMTVKQNLARSYASAEDFKNAKIVYQDLIKTEPSKWDHWLELARVCISQDDKTTAAACLDHLKKNAPSFHSDEVNAMMTELGF